MRVLYDVSTLGLAHLYQQSRGGSFRVDLHMAEALAASSECELLFCANHSTVAYHGCETFLRGHRQLRSVPLIGAATTGRSSSLRAAAARVHAGVRRLFGSNVLPAAVRQLGVAIDRRLHPAIGDGTDPVDVLHSPATPLPPRTYGRSPQRFLTIYDLAHLQFTDLYSPPHQRSVLAALRSLEPGDHVITASHFSPDELCEHHVAPRERIHVVPLAADPKLFYRCGDPDVIAAVRHRYGIPDGPYVLSLNSPDPRKNVDHAIQAFARMAEEGRDAVVSLVLAGKAGPGSDRIHEAIAQHPALHGRIVLTGYVPDEDLAPLYSGARLFVYPSRYEGFGLPPLEAMQCGTPVITCNTSSLPEVVGDGGVMVDSGDLDALSSAMLTMARAADRAALQERAEAQARRFSWERSTADTLRTYRTVLERDRSSAGIHHS